METIKFLKKLKEAKLKILSFADVKKLLDTDNSNTTYKFIERLISKGVVKRLKNCVYVCADFGIDDFEIGNYIYTPSYISLETALNFYGILSQFPYTITFVTTKKTKKFEIEGKVFEYVHFDKKYFFGYIKQGGFLIATKEKAVFDILYLIAKRIRKISFDELDLSNIDKKVLDGYVKNSHYIPLIKLYKQL